MMTLIGSPGLDTQIVGSRNETQGQNVQQGGQAENAHAAATFAA